MPEPIQKERLLASPDYRMFALADADNAANDAPVPDDIGSQGWLGLRSAMFYIGTAQPLFPVTLDIEYWDRGPPSCNDGPEVMERSRLSLPSGRPILSEVTAGSPGVVFVVPTGTYASLVAAWSRRQAFRDYNRLLSMDASSTKYELLEQELCGRERYAFQLWAE
ncbi:hypothetical protein F8568_035385 [Actinomadura sp. LD22]|uniref:Uncharacterized protein n=1 Tax=Actinomadura physcomitrii TaxID=2650748 RepID=A0A6I4MNX6_9ACTN|nr:hypothetical protein [Actinomadura physcomitrii]MWA05557.1 hypothetical protein [Actinomadura physcomitrii]